MRQSIFLVCATLAAATCACKPEETRRSPPPSASPTSAVGSYNPYATIPAGGAGAVPTAATGNAGQEGLGCNGDAEPVPKDANESAMRACCDKLMTANACQGSACWAKGVIESVRKAMEPGGMCAQ